MRFPHLNECTAAFVNELGEKIANELYNHHFELFPLSDAPEDDYKWEKRDAVINYGIHQALNDEITKIKYPELKFSDIMVISVVISTNTHLDELLANDTDYLIDRWKNRKE